MTTIYGRGIYISDLTAALNEIITDWNLTMAKLDADSGGVTGEDYASTCNMSTNTAVTEGKALGQQDLYDVLNDAITKINACNAKLDADTGVTGEDYASLWNVTDNVGSGNTIAPNGMNQKDIVSLLSTLKTNINGIQAKLDADTLVGDTNYAATNPIAFSINTDGC